MMRRTAMKPGAPMKRTAFARIAARERAEVSKITRTLKSKGPRMTPIRKAARDQECTLRLPGCNYRTDTTVLCHSNELADGKGMGLKVSDLCAAFGCAPCHDMLDGRRPRPDGFTYEAMLAQFSVAVVATHEVLRSMGLIKKESV